MMQQIATDERVLALEAMGATNLGDREQALDAIRSDDVLKQLARRSDCMELRRSAARRVQDETLHLQLLAELGASEFDQVEYVRTIRSTNALAWVAVYGSNASVRGQAVRRLNNQALLSRVARSDESHWVRASAVEKLRWSAVVREIAATDVDPFVRSVAEKQLQTLAA